MSTNDEQIFLERFFSLVEKEGGFYRVAEKAGISPKAFYAMRDRKSLPNSKTLLKILSVIDNVDLNRILKGEPSPEEQKLQKQIEELTDKISELSRTNSAFVTMAESMGKKDKAVITLPKIGLRNIKLRDFIFPNRSRFGSQPFC